MRFVSFTPLPSSRNIDCYSVIVNYDEYELGPIANIQYTNIQVQASDMDLISILTFNRQQLTVAANS